MYYMQSGKLSWSLDKEIHVKMLIAFYLGVVQSGYLSGEYHEDYNKNIDEMHFFINMDDERTLGFCSDQEMKYTDMDSGGEAMIMVVHITRGRGAAIMPSMIIFKNQIQNYPICRL